MRTSDEAVTQAEIDAFLDGQLDRERRFAIADHLSRDPGRAMQAMADLRTIEGVRLAMAAASTPPPPELEKTAARLSRRLDGGVSWPLRMAAAMALVAIGWGGNAVWTGQEQDRALTRLTPLAETALDAREAVVLRQALSLPPSPEGADRIASVLGVALPSLPPHWHLRDVQVVATPGSPGLALMIDTPDMGEVMLLTLRHDDGVTDQPRAFAHRGSAVAVFENGPMAYVLVDAEAGATDDVSRQAQRLLRRIN